MLQTCLAQKPAGCCGNTRWAMDAWTATHEHGPRTPPIRRPVVTTAEYSTSIQLQTQEKMKTPGDSRLRGNTQPCQHIMHSKFIGACTEFHWSHVWRTEVEPKCRFFLWLLLQMKLPTTDRIIKRGGQTNPICKLCYCRPESHGHMIVKCTYAKRVWQKVELWSGEQGLKQNQIISKISD
jgi:hypothetical protein